MLTNEICYCKISCCKISRKTYVINKTKQLPMGSEKIRQII